MKADVWINASAFILNIKSLLNSDRNSPFNSLLHFGWHF